MHSYWSIEIFELKISQWTNQSACDTFAIVVHECVGRETQHTHVLTTLNTKISFNTLQCMNEYLSKYMSEYSMESGI